MTAGEGWTLESIRAECTSWTLSSDAQMLEYMQTFSESLLSRLNSSLKDIEDLVNMTSAVNTSVNNTFNDFNMLSNVQFLESRVYEDDETAIEANQGLPEVNQEEDSDIIAGRIRTAVEYGLTVMDAAFDVHSISPDIRGSDSEDSDSEQTSTITYEPVMEAKDPYSFKILPYIIGSSEYCNDDSVGLQRYSETDDEDDDTSESEDDTDSMVSLPRKDTRAGTVSELPGIPEQGALAQNDVFDSESSDSSSGAPKEKRAFTKQSLFDEGDLFGEEKKSDRTKAFESIFDSSSDEEKEEVQAEKTESSRAGSVSKKPTGGVSIFGDVEVFRRGTVTVIDPDTDTDVESQKEDPAPGPKDAILPDEGGKFARTAIPPPPKQGFFNSSSDESEDEAPSKKTKEPSIFDDGDDSEDGMFSTPKKTVASKESKKIPSKDPFSLFDSPSDDDDGDVNTKNIQDTEHEPVMNTEPQQVAPTKKRTAKGKAASKLIADELNVKLNKNKPVPTKSVPTKSAPTKSTPTKSAPGLFDSDDESEDMFSAKNEAVKTVKVEETPKMNDSAKIEPVKAKIASIFDDSDSDDMFSVKPKARKNEAAKFEPESETSEPKTETIKPKTETTNTKFKTKGIFDDSDSDDMFSVTPKPTKTEAVKISESKPVELPPQKQETRPTKQTPKVASIFDDSDSDDMFGPVKTKSVMRAEPPPMDEVKTKVEDASGNKLMRDAFDDSDDDDMFDGVIPKANVSRDSLLIDDSPPKPKAGASADSLSDDIQSMKSGNSLFDDSPTKAAIVDSPKLTGSGDSLFDSPPKANISRDALFDDSPPKQTKDALFEASPPKKTIDRESLLAESNPKVAIPSSKEKGSGHKLFDEDDGMFGESYNVKPKIDNTDDVFANGSSAKSVSQTKSHKNRKNKSDDEMFETISKPECIPSKDGDVVTESSLAATKITDDFDLFADDGADDLFAVVSPRDRAKSRSKSKPVDPEFDLFADTSTVVKPKDKKSKSRSGSRSRSGSKTKKLEGKKSSDLFADDDTEPVVDAKPALEVKHAVEVKPTVEVDGDHKSTRKPVGGVSMFGGVDIASALKKNILEKETLPPEDIPKSSEESDTSTIVKSQLPEDKQISNVAKLQGDLNISVSMLQGQPKQGQPKQGQPKPKPSKKDPQPVDETSGSTGVLTSVTKSRVKGGVGRRPPTRGGRRGKHTPTSSQNSEHTPAPSTPKKSTPSTHNVPAPETPCKTLDTSSDFFSTTESPYKSSPPTNTPISPDTPSYSNDDDLFTTPSATITSDPKFGEQPKHSTPNKTSQPVSEPKKKEKKKKKEEVDIFDDDFDLFSDPTPSKSSKKIKTKKSASDDLFGDDGDLFTPTKSSAKKKTTKKEKKNFDSLFEDPLS